MEDEIQHSASDACWACGEPREMPDHAWQVRDLAEQHYLHTAVWHWAPAEFEELREILDAHGPAAYLGAIISRRPMYGSARIITADRKVIEISRRTLIARAKEREHSELPVNEAKKTRKPRGCHRAALRKRSPWDPVREAAAVPMEIDAGPRKVASPSVGIRPKYGAHACILCTLLVAPGEQPEPCEVRGCPGPSGFIPAPTTAAAWRALIASALRRGVEL
jgi:hypothetical protein